MDSKTFNHKIDIWELDTMKTSSPVQMLDHEIPQEIIAEGQPVIPLIIERIKDNNNKGYLFLILEEITGEAMARDSDTNVEYINEQWVNWWEDQNSTKEDPQDQDDDEDEDYDDDDEEDEGPQKDKGCDCEDCSENWYSHNDCQKYVCNCEECESPWIHLVWALLIAFICLLIFCGVTDERLSDFFGSGNNGGCNCTMPAPEPENKEDDDLGRKIITPRDTPIDRYSRYTDAYSRYRLLYGTPSQSTLNWHVYRGESPVCRSYRPTSPETLLWWQLGQPSKSGLKYPLTPLHHAE